MFRLLAGALALAVLVASPAEASGRHHGGLYGYYSSAHYWRHRHAAERHVWRHHLSGGRPSCYSQAASMGGPCGCLAASKLLGLTQHVWNGINLWLAQDWLKFPRSDPGPGTAAVWPHRHVAAVVSAPRGGRITVDDTYGVRDVSMSGVVFVQPPRRKTELVKWAGGIL